MTSLAPRLSGNQRFGFVSKAVSADTFSVVRMHGTEALGRTYRFEIVLVADDAHVDLDAMLAQSATLTIFPPERGTDVAPYSGVLAEFEQLHQANSYTFYRAVLVPRLWRLTLTRTSDVYLNEQTIVDTLQQVLRGGQLIGTDARFKLTASYRPRSYVCQFEETHFDFLSRWMEKEGMYYYFEQDGNADRLVVVDDKAMLPADALAVDYRPSGELDTGVAANLVQAFVCRQKPLPARVALQDYNYRKAAVPLVVSAPVAERGIGEVMYYGENFRDPEEGQRYARLRAQELLCAGKVFSGESTAVGLRSGYFIDLSHHYRDDFNGRHLVTEVTHEGSQAAALLAGLKSPFSDESTPGTEIIYRNTFAAIPADVQFRSARVTPKPRVNGTLNATIDAEGGGQYAELDAYGQYKIQVPFDRTDKVANKGSARVRLATPYSGSGHGMHFPLHKNAEVLLSFTDGDPDQPVIVGTATNSENPNGVTQSNPTQNRLTTSGGHQIVMDDTKGKELMWLHSPNSSTNVLIGETAQGPAKTPATSGWHMMTLGASNDFGIGPSFKMSVGPSYQFSLGGEVGVVGVNSSKCTLGTGLSGTVGNSVTFNCANATQVNLGTTSQVSDNFNQTASKGVLLSGGSTAQQQHASVTSTMRWIKLAVAAIHASNVSLGLATGGLLSAFDKEQDYLQKDPSTLGINIGSTTTSLVGNTVSFAGMFLLLRKLANLCAKLTFVSTLKLDNRGVELAAQLETGPERKLAFSATDAELSTLDGGITNSLKMSSAGSVLSFNNASSASFGPDSAQLNVANTAKVTLSAAEIASTIGTSSATLTAAEVKLAASPTTALTLNAEGASLNASPTSNVQVTQFGVTLGFGANVLKTGPVGIDADGLLVMLG